MRLIARLDDDRYLIEVAPREDGVRMARVIDLKQGILFNPFLLDSILARGYWVNYTGPPKKLAKLLRRVIEY